MEANYNEELNATKELLKGLSIHQETTHEAEEEKQYRPSISGWIIRLHFANNYLK